MQTATIHQLKSELTVLNQKQLLQLCLRLARFKKENKELLTYLIFDAGDEENFRHVFKVDLEQQFNEINKSNVYWIKKSLRKILRTLDKFVRFSGNKETEIEFRLHFIRQISFHHLPIKRNKVLVNMYESQVRKIKIALEKVHEDLQHDYGIELDSILKERVL